MTTLASLVDGLARALAALDDERILILSRPGSRWYVSEEGSNRFVQFACCGDTLRAESVGERYLEGHDQLTSDQRARLLELGWSAPDEGGNYWKEWSAPVPLGEVSAMALQTLGAVHGVEHGEQLDFDACAEVLRAFGLPDADDE